MRCKVCGEASPIFSGVDAFLFGVPTEVYCVECVLENPELRGSIARIPEVLAPHLTPRTA